MRPQSRPASTADPLANPLALLELGRATLADPAVVWLYGDTVLYDGVREVASRPDDVRARLRWLTRGEPLDV